MTKADDTRTRILDAAAVVLRTRGYSNTKLNDIAKHAGTFAGSLYYHFNSKDELVEEVMLEGIYRNTRHIVMSVEQLGPDATVMRRLQTAIVAHLNFLLAGDNYSSAVARAFDDLPNEIKRKVLMAYVSFDNYWRDLIQAAQLSGDANPNLNPTVVRKLLLGMLESSARWYRPGRLGPDEITRQACDLFIKGFAWGGESEELAEETRDSRDQGRKGTRLHAAK